MTNMENSAGYKKLTFWERNKLSGGYLLQLELEERYASSASGFVTAHGQPVLVKSPEYIGKAQMNYIRSLVQSFENAIYAEDGIDATVYNLQGVAVRQTKVQDGAINLAGLQQGVYAIQLGKLGSTLIRK